MLNSLDILGKYLENHPDQEMNISYNCGAVALTLRDSSGDEIISCWGSITRAIGCTTVGLEAAIDLLAEKITESSKMEVQKDGPEEHI